MMSETKLQGAGLIPLILWTSCAVKKDGHIPPTIFGKLPLLLHSLSSKLMLLVSLPACQKPRTKIIRIDWFLSESSNLRHRSKMKQNYILSQTSHDKLSWASEIRPMKSRKHHRNFAMSWEMGSDHKESRFQWRHPQANAKHSRIAFRNALISQMSQLPSEKTSVATTSAFILILL